MTGSLEGQLESARGGLLLALHHHQPPGTPEGAMRAVFERCYRPLLERIEAHGGVCVAMHHSGALLRWLERAGRAGAAYLDGVAQLVADGRIEVIGGGAYAPVLSLIPEGDARGQLALHSDLCLQHFGQRPTGAWPGAGVWEPRLAQLLSRAGFRYTLLEEAQLRASGPLPAPLAPAYLIEYGGDAVAVFGSDPQLGSRLASQTVDELLGWLAEAGARQQPVCSALKAEDLAVDDWLEPGGRLDLLFEALGSLDAPIPTRLPSAWLDACPPKRRVTPPASCPEQLGEWALAPDAARTLHRLRQRLAEQGELRDARPYLRGGLFEGFLVRYPEADRMHKRMLATSARLRQQGGSAAAIEALYRGQCASALWHGEAGGLHRPELRDAVYRSLIEAEARIDADREPFIDVSWADFDGDLHPEVMVRSQHVCLWVAPARGGSLQSLEHRVGRVNLLNGLTRCEEGYHADILADDPSRTSEEHTALRSALVYDRRPRAGFQDHFFAPDADLTSLLGPHPPEELGDFADIVYAVPEEDGAASGSDSPLGMLGAAAASINLVAEREIEGIGPVVVEKAYSAHQSRAGFTVTWRISASEGGEHRLLFAPELSLGLGCVEALDRDTPPDEDPHRIVMQETVHPFGSTGIADVPQDFAIEDTLRGFRMRIAPNTSEGTPTLWRYGLESVSRVRAGGRTGFARLEQGTVLVLAMPVVLRSAPSFIAVHVDFEPLATGSPEA